MITVPDAEPFKLDTGDFTFTAHVKCDVPMWGVGYSLTGRESFPYTTETFLDENFEIKPAIDNWQHITYTDSLWNQSVLPIVHGSERYAEEDMRRSQ